jgi:hypothetical protein
MLRPCIKKAIVVLLLALIVVPLVGFDGRPAWGDPSGQVWYYGRLVPFGTLLDKGVVPHCHDGLGPGVLTCYDTNEELSAAIGVDLPGVDEAAVERLRQHHFFHQGPGRCGLQHLLHGAGVRAAQLAP